jgi:hypothetical protein
MRCFAGSVTMEWARKMSWAELGWSMMWWLAGLVMSLERARHRVELRRAAVKKGSLEGWRRDRGGAWASAACWASSRRSEAKARRKL